jgi:hypothetical protein
MGWPVLSALIAVAGSLLGVVLGFFAQHLLADLAHRRHLDDLKREAYAEMLRAVSASYAQASSGGGTAEDAALLKATTVIELLAAPEIGSAARNLEHLVSTTHTLLRQSGYEAARAKVEDADQARLDLIRLFKADLGIRQRPAITATPHRDSGPAAPAVPAADPAGPIAGDGNPGTH